MKLSQYPRPKDDTGLGIHGGANAFYPLGEHSSDYPYWIAELKQMGFKWYKLTVAGDAGGEAITGAAECRHHAHRAHVPSRAQPRHHGGRRPQGQGVAEAVHRPGRALLRGEQRAQPAQRVEGRLGRQRRRPHRVEEGEPAPARGPELGQGRRVRGRRRRPARPARPLPRRPLQRRGLFPA